MSNVHNKKKSAMAYLNTKVAPSNISVENINEYFNINGSHLDPNYEHKFTLVFGDAISIASAIRYATDKTMLPTQLMGDPKHKTKKSIKGGHRYVPNFWAYVGYLVIERITQDKSLMATLLEDKTIINVECRTVNTFNGTMKAIVPDSGDKMYSGVVRYIADTICRVGNEDKDALSTALSQALYELKSDKDKSVFAGMPFTAEYM